MVPSSPSCIARSSRPLDHERLDAYQIAVALDALVVRVARKAPRGHGGLADQAQRASDSAVLNLAEAVGREGADRARCLRISRGSALELDAALTLLAERGACASAARLEARELSERLVAMLTRLVQVAGGECLDDMAMLGADRGLLELLEKPKWPSPDASRQFLLGFHDEKLIDKARAAMIPGESSFVPAENAPLAGLARVLTEGVRRLQQVKPSKLATLELDATCIESHKREAMPLYEGGRGYQPEVVYWVEQDVVLADEFRDGNVPAGKRPLDVVRRAFAALPESVERRRFRADSAAYEEHLLQWLADPAQRIERFTVSADMGEQLRRLCEAVPNTGWALYEERTDVTVHWTEVEFAPGDWPKRAALLRWHYQKAGHIEIVHDVLKNELGAGVLPCGAFGANAAWFRLCALTYNVLSAMKTVGLPPKLADARPKRLRFAVFTIPARVISHARQLFARVAQVLSDGCDLLPSRRRLRDAWHWLLQATRPMASEPMAQLAAPS